MEKINKATTEVSAECQTKVDVYFEENPTEKEVFTSSDLYLFPKLKFATDHGSTLEDKNILNHKNPNLIEVEVDDNFDNDDEL